MTDIANEVLDALRPVLSDLKRTTKFTAEVRGRERGVRDPRDLVVLSVDGVDIGLIAVDITTPLVMRVVHVADQVSGLVVENVRDNGQAISWPPCVDGNQPLDPEIRDGVAVWVSPYNTDSPVTPIGCLGLENRKISYRNT